MCYVVDTCCVVVRYSVPMTMSVFHAFVFLGAVLCSSGQYCAPRGSTVLLGAVLCSSGQYCPPRGSTVFLGAVLCSLGQYCAPRGSVVLLGAVLCSSGQYCAPRRSVVFLGAVLCSSEQCCAPDLRGQPGHSGVDWLLGESRLRVPPSFGGGGVGLGGDVMIVPAPPSCGKM
jgi:hypothetical protein